MQAFTQIKSTTVPIPIENIDTDQIIPARFLKATSKEGFGENLFRDWRFDDTGKKKKFVLNDSTYSGEILVAGRNFGCGSSREHAAWALADYGFKVVVSSFFADIFRSNALNNFIVPVQVTQDFLDHMFAEIQGNPKLKVTMDLEAESISLPDGKSQQFDINPYKKICIMRGYDDIDYLLALNDHIERFEAGRFNDYSLIDTK